MNNTAKAVMLYHRAYRILPGSVKVFLLQFICCALPFSAVTILFYPQITHLLCQITEFILAPYFLPGTVWIAEMPYISSIGQISFLALPGKIPGFPFSLGNALVSLLLLIVLPFINHAKPLVIFAIMLSFVHLLSSLFFLFIPELFPYGAADYSQLYMLQQVSIWFFVPIITGLALLPLPSPITAKCVTMVITCIYSLIFGTVRYAVFLFIVAKISLIYMAIIFFALGPLIDFVYVVGIYSVHINWLANKMKGDFKLWKWQYLS